MTEKELLLQYLTKVYNKTEDEIMSALYDEEGNLSENAFETVNTMAVAKIDRLKKEGNDKFKNGEAKATKEVASKFEQLFKEKTGFTSEAENFELMLDEFIEEQKDKSKRKPDITDEMIKQHPVYLELEKRRVPKEEYDKTVNEFNQFKTSIERKEKFSVIKSKARQILETLNPALPEAPTVRDNLINVYLSTFEQYDFADDGKGGYIALNKDGERLTDDVGNAVYLDTLAKQQAANYFTFLKQAPKGGAGNNGSGDGGVNPDAIKITSTKQYNDLMKGLQGNSDDEVKKRIELFKAYKKAKEAGVLAD